MSYSFIKDNLNSIVKGTRVDIPTLEVFIAGKENSFILNHNIEAISSMLSFLNSDNNIFILNGFMGSGKTYIADLFLDFLDDQVLVFKNSYQEAINPDDILLSLFKDFSLYHNEKKIVLPKVETNVFSEKINTYIKYCNKPMLFIFDSFEINMKSKDTQKDILDFINYLSHFEKVKIIICSRTFKQNDLLSPIGVTGYELKSLTKDEVFNFLKENEIIGTPFEKEELFKATRGHYLLLEMSSLLIKLTGQTLNAFSGEYKKSTKNFLEFLISKIISLASNKFVKPLIFLTIARHGVSADFLILQGIATYEDIDYLVQKHIVSEKFGKYYIKDYLKNEYIKNINLESRVNAHKYIIEMYENELPAKPFDRLLFLSRQTMRQEIAFHKSKIEALSEHVIKTGKSKLPDTQDFNYLSYSRTSGYDDKSEKRKKIQQRYVNEIKKRDQKRKIELSFEDSKLLNTIKQEDNIEKNLIEITNITNDEINKVIKPINKAETPAVPDSLDDYIEIAQNYEDAYNFASAILYYKKALSYTSDAYFEDKEPLLYSKLAICYKKTQDFEEAERTYEKVYNLYVKKDPIKANEILLMSAHMYAEAYKFEKARELYKRILYSPLGVTSEMIIRVYLDLSELEDNNLDVETAIKYANKALNEAEKVADIRLLTECNFKNALLYDDSNNIELATKYYLRCVQVSNDPTINVFMSSAYANLAEISTINNNIIAAKMYYELSIDADKKQNNLEGLYYSYTKLAALYRNENPEKTHELLLKALSAAKRFDDISYAVSIYIEIGDNYLGTKDYKRSLKSYILAKRLVPEHSTEDLAAKITQRISKIKSLLGERMFSNLVEEIKKKP